jgi:tetratricopeptide (TPR) repeat protein
MVALTAAPGAALGEVRMGDLSPEDQRRARTLLLDAKEAFEQGDYERAQELLEEVYVIFPNPRVLKRLGEAHQNLGNNQLALDYYEQFVAEAPGDEDVPEVNGKIAYLRKLLAEASSTISVQTVPPGAQVVVSVRGNEVARGVTPLELKVSEGVYELEITREGFISQTEEVKLRYRARLDLNYELAQPPVREPSALNWTLVGVGTTASVAALGVGVWWALEDQRIDDLIEARRAEEDDLEKAALTLEIRDVTADNNNRSVAGWVLGGVGAATLVTAWLLWPTNELTMGAMPMPGGGAVTVQGRF